MEDSLRGVREVVWVVWATCRHVAVSQVTSRAVEW